MTCRGCDPVPQFGMMGKAVMHVSHGVCCMCRARQNRLGKTVIIISTPYSLSQVPAAIISRTTLRRVSSAGGLLLSAFLAALERGQIRNENDDIDKAAMDFLLPKITSSLCQCKFVWYPSRRRACLHKCRADSEIGATYAYFLR